jgi:type VI protein secretion system component VasF
MNESEVIERAETLPDRYANRVRPQDLDGMRSMVDGGEWQELVDLLIASLRLTQAPVTADERAELRSLVKAMDLPADALTELNVES